MRDPLLSQPVPEFKELLRHRAKRADLLGRLPASSGHQYTSHHGLFVHVEPAAPLVHDVHGHHLRSTGREEVSLESQILLCVLPAVARATVGGASGHPGQFYRGLTAPKLEPDLLALSHPEDSPRSVFILRWSLRQPMKFYPDLTAFTGLLLSRHSQLGLVLRRLVVGLSVTLRPPISRPLATSSGWLMPPDWTWSRSRIMRTTRHF